VNDIRSLLTLEHIGQSYGSAKRGFTAVQDISLSVWAGEFVALLGPSGCGKSTLLRIVTGLQRPTDGRVLYRGTPLTGVNPYAAMVFQSFALFPWLTVLGNVEVALKARGVSAKTRRARALDLLDRVGLDGFETAYPRELSGGMRQKVGFARAMAVEPELLCLDEPFSALDVLSAETLRGELLELWTSGHIPTRALLMVTHSIEEAVFMADRIVVMEKNPGRVVQDLKVTLPHPRIRKAPAFLEIVDRIYGILAGQTQPEHVELGSAPGESGRTRALPHVSINELAGLLEHLALMPYGREDIFRLAGELKVDSDRILGLMEAAELLGFATITQGDVTLTPLGETFAEASILARKEIFAARSRRLPIIKWLVAMLRAAEHHQLEWDVVQAALELEFPPEEGKRQLDTAVRWGRYAEILAYEDNSEMISLEPMEALAPTTPSEPKQKDGPQTTLGGSS
jgi:NitT/TauT family transport system ATP-binding protein